MKKINLFTLFITLFSAGCAAMAEEATTSQAKRHHRAIDYIYTQQELDDSLNKPQPCPYCKTVVSSAQDLANHVRYTCVEAVTQAKRLTYLCPLCLEHGETTTHTSLKNLRERHMYPAHGNIKQQCQFCGKLYANVQIHIRKAHPGATAKKYAKQTAPIKEPCPHCRKPYSPEQLEEHIEKQHQKHVFTREEIDVALATQPQHCPYCAIIQDSTQELAKHIRHMHKEVSYFPFICPICWQDNQKVTATKSLKKLKEEHMYSSHGNVKNPCPFCEKLCAKAYLRQHIREKHAQQLTEQLISEQSQTCTQEELDGLLIKPTSCPHCSAQSSSTQDLAKHIQHQCTNAGSQEKRYPFICPICWDKEKKIITRSCLKNLKEGHIYPVHGNIKQQCPVCGESFANRRMHLAKQHPEEYALLIAARNTVYNKICTLLAQVIQCPYCKNHQAPVEQLAEHIPTCSAITDESDRRYAFICPECSKDGGVCKNKYKETLIRHLLTEHLKKKLLHCTDCDAYFLTNRQLEDHRQTHRVATTSTDEHVDIAQLYTPHRDEHPQEETMFTIFDPEFGNLMDDIVRRLADPTEEAVAQGLENEIPYSNENWML